MIKIVNKKTEQLSIQGLLYTLTLSIKCKEELWRWGKVDKTGWGKGGDKNEMSDFKFSSTPFFHRHRSIVKKEHLRMTHTYALI